ncbi:MAG: hypothetical protein LBS17_06305 [Actinomycetes bacterium]|jgi:hypothetical protein|nr:hypothetical protein [Actinomycetes bacterium]
MSDIILPRKRSILWLRCIERERKLQQRERKRLRQLARARRAQTTKRFVLKPVHKLLASVMSIALMIAVSVLLTLFANYLNGHPAFLQRMISPITRLLQTQVAGAAETAATSSGPDTVQAGPGESGETVLLRGVHQVDRVVVYDDLPDNDVARLDAIRTFRVRSDEDPDATCDAELRAAEWHWIVTAYDRYGLPVRYRAEVTYRGLERYCDVYELPHAVAGGTTETTATAHRRHHADTHDDEGTYSPERLSRIFVGTDRSDEVTRSVSLEDGQRLVKAQMTSNPRPLRRWPVWASLAAGVVAGGGAASAVVFWWKRKKKREDEPDKGSMEG